MKKGEAATLDDVVLGDTTAMPAGFICLEDDGNGTPYFEIDDEENMEEMDIDGEFRRKPSGHLRFKKSKGVPNSV